MVMSKMKDLLFAQDRPPIRFAIFSISHVTARWRDQQPAWQDRPVVKAVKRDKPIEILNQNNQTNQQPAANGPFLVGATQTTDNNALGVWNTAPKLP